MGMDKNEIGQTLVKLRKQAGLTQDELSEWTGISQGHISHLEKTGELTSIEHVRNLADAFGFAPGDLISMLWDTPTGGNNAVKKRNKRKNNQQKHCNRSKGGQKR